MKEWTLDAKTENIAVLTDLVNAELEAAGCPMKTELQIDMAIDEIFANIAQYAYGGGTGAATVRLALRDDARAVTLTFSDSGTPYDPLKKPDPDTTLSAEERQIGGLGIFLVKKTMDGMTYERRDGKNVLTLQKNFN